MEGGSTFTIGKGFGQMLHTSRNSTNTNNRGTVPRN